MIIIPNSVKKDDFDDLETVNQPKDFEVYHHTKPKEEPCGSGITAQILPELTGKPWNKITMCYVLSFRPTYVRVSRGSVTADAASGRITVIIDKNRKITKIYQELHAVVPANMCGHDLYCAMMDLK